MNSEEIFNNIKSQNKSNPGVQFDPQEILKNIGAAKTETQDIDANKKDQQTIPQYVDVDKVPEQQFVQPERRSYFVAGNVNNNEINTTAQKPNEIEYEANTIDDEKKKDDYFALTKLSTNKKDIVKNAIKYITGAANPIQSAINTVGAFTGKDDKEIVLEGVRGFTGSTIDFASSLYRFFKQNTDIAKTYTKEQLDKIANLGNVMTGGESFADDIAEQYTEFYKQIDEENKILRDKTERFLQYTGIAKTDKDGFIYDLVGGGASLMYAIGLAAITKSPAAAAEMFGMYQYQSLYEEGIDRGFSPIKARAIGVAGGAFEGGLEMVGLHVLIETLKARRSFTKILKAALTEFTQEASQQGAEETLAKLSGLREDSTVGQIISNVFYAGVIGAILGGGSATVSNVFYKQISDSATRELINNGMQSDYAKQMVDNVLKLSVSPQAAQEVVSISKDEQSPVTYKNADPRETYKETGEAIKKALDPQQKRGVELEFIEEKKKFVDSVAKALINSGKFTEEEAYKQAEAQANLADGLARIGFEQDNIRPSEYYKRFKVDVTSGNIETDERNVDEENPFVDVSFDPVDFDDEARAAYEAAMDAQQEEMDKLQKEFTMSLKDHANFFRDLGIGAIRRPTPDGVGKDRWGEYKDLSNRVKNYFFSDDTTAMSWDDAQKLLETSSSSIKDLFAYLSNADEKAKVYNQKEVFSKVFTKEKEDIKQKAIADGTFMKAPNGKDSNLPEQLWLIVRTKAFKSWFGDWLNDPQNASKVVDENGEPLVVYHGTANDFRVFNRNINYFTDNKDVANTYTGTRKVYEVFANIRNPITINANKEKWSMIDISNISIDGVDNIEDFLKQNGASVWKEKGALRTTPADILSAIEDNFENNDGVIIKDIYDEGGYSAAAKINLGNDYVVFNSRQVKSINNRGSFDRNNPDIYLQAAYHGTPHRFDEFSTDKIGTGEGAQAHGWGLYFAENKDVSESYRKKLVSDEYKYDGKRLRDLYTFNGGKPSDYVWARLDYERPFGTDIFKQIAKVRKDLREMVSYWEKSIENFEGNEKQQAEFKKSLDFTNKEIEFLNSLDLEKFKKEEGQLFKVDIPENDVLLDEDKTFSEQPEKVQKALKEIAEKELSKDVKTDFLKGYEYEIEYKKKHPETKDFNLQTEISNVAQNGKKRAIELMKRNSFGKEWKARIDFINSIKNIDDFIISSKPIDFKDYKGKELTGKGIYNKIVFNLKNKDISSKEASLILNKYGVKGITYDGYNDGRAYVVFDDKAVDVLETFYQPAYHGTPHRFDEFSTDKIGTGEGAQAHGWGLYFAANRGVSERYRRVLSEGDEEVLIDGKEPDVEIKPYLYRKAYLPKEALKKEIKNQIEETEAKNKEDKAVTLVEQSIIEKLKNNINKKVEDIKFDDEEKILVDGAISDIEHEFAFAGEYERYKKEKNTKKFTAGLLGYMEHAYERDSKVIKNNEDFVNKLKEIDTDKIEVRKLGQVYEVDIPENDVLLDEDKLFQEQPKKVQEAIEEIMKDDEDGKLYNDLLDTNTYGEDEIVDRSLYLSTLNGMYKDIDKGNTGEQIYDDLAFAIKDKYGISLNEAKKEASLILNKYGIKGITYDGYEDGRAYVVFDDKAVKVLEKYYQEQQQEQPRGATTVFDRQYFINLFANADKSTLMHEMAHAWLSEINYFASAKNATNKVLDIKKQLDSWLGVPDSNGRYSVEQQEKFAQNFEIYLKEGKAPTAKLKTVFARFKTWLSEIYDRIKDELPKLNDDVRELFDSILSRSYDVPDSNIYAGKEKAIKEVIKNIQEGRASEVDGITIDDVYNLLNMAYMRKPNKPSKNLKQLLNDKNIYDFNELNKAGADTVLAILKDGGYVKADATAEAAMDLAKQALDGKPVYRLADQWRVAGDIDFARNLRVLEKVIEFSQIDSTLEKILELQEEGYRNVEQGDVEQAQNDYKRLFSADVKEAKKIVEDIINRLHKKRFIDRAAQKQMIVDLNFSSTVEEIRESVLNVIEDLQDEIKLVKEQLRNPRKPIVRKDKTIPPGKNATEEEKNNYKKYMRKQINRLLKQVLPSKQNNNKVSKFGNIEIQRFFEELIRINKMSREEAERFAMDRIAKDNEWILKDEKGEGFENKQKIINMFVSYKSKIITQNSPELLKELYDNLQKINIAGRNEKQINDYLTKAKRNKDMDELLDNIEKNGSKNKVSNWIKTFYNYSVANWYSCINSIAGEKQAEKDALELYEKNASVKAKTVQDRIVKRTCDVLGLKTRSQFDKKIHDYLKEKYEFIQNKIDHNGNEVQRKQTLNKMELICCYIWAKNKQLKERIIRAYGNEQFNEMMAKLDKYDMSWGDIIQEETASLYDDVNKVYVKMYGLDLPQTESYFPSSTERIQGNMDLLKDVIIQTSSPSFFKGRVDSNLIIMKFGNPINIAFNHIFKASRFAVMQEKLADIYKTYLHPDVSDKLKDIYGSDKIFNYIKKMLDNVKFENFTAQVDIVNSIFDHLANTYVITRIAGKPSIMIKQLLSFTNYMEDIDSALWLKHFGKMVANPSKFKQIKEFMYEHSPYLKQRYESGSQNEALEKAMEGQANALLRIKSFKGFLSIMTRVGDIGAIIFGGYPMIQAQLEKGVPIEKAFENFEKATLRSQQANFSSTLSNWQNYVKQNPLLRAIFAFANTPTQYTRKLVDVCYKMAHGDEKFIKGKGFKTLALYGIEQSFVYTAFTSLALLNGLVNGDWDDLKDDVWLSLFQVSNFLGIPILGQVYNQAVSMFVTGNFVQDKRVPIIDDMTDFFKAIKKAYDNGLGDMDVKDWIDTTDKLASITTGVPIKTLYNTWISSWADIINGDYGKGFVKLYGATESRANKIFD